ncbi:MAG: hypothetical protein ABJG42_15175 [Vibrio splendidus]
MKREKLFEFYERLYFHEMQNRDTLYTRVQINFALIFTGFSIVSYMLRMLDFSSNKELALVFAVLAILSVTVSARGVFFLVKAFWGTEYKGVPDPAETDRYRIEVENHKESILQYNRDYPENKQPEIDIEVVLSQFLIEQVRDCATHNTYANEIRFTHVHNSIKWLLLAAVPFLFASVLFVAFDLDASSPRKEALIYNQSLVEKLDSINGEIANVNSGYSEILEAQKLCQTNLSLALHRHLQAHQVLLDQERLLKMVSHLKECEGNMSEQKPPTPPPPPQAPAQPVARTFKEDAPPKTNK